MKRGKVCSFIFVLIIAISLVGCSKEQPSSSEKENNEAFKQELKVALSAQPNTFDPLMNTAVVAGYVGGNIFETLLTLDSKGRPVPLLAESVESSEDGKTHTFHLRKNAQFHNGKEMTSEDVVASMNRWAEKNKKVQGLFGEVQFEAADQYTVVMKLQEYALDIWDLVAGRSQYAAIMPKEVVEAAGDLGVTEYIGTGPYAFVEQKQNQYVHLKKFNDYKGDDSPSDGLAGKKEAYTENIFFYFVTDPSTRAAGIQTG